MASPELGQAQISDEMLGDWQVSLKTDGGPLVVKLVVEGDRSDASNRPQVFLVNGPERILVDAKMNIDQVIVSMEHYASKIDCRWSNSSSSFVGNWTKQRSGNDVAVVECTISKYQPPKQLTLPTKFLGRWAVDFADSEDQAVAVFESDGGNVLGTFLTTTGDYRYLHGVVTLNGELVLSCFDGAHAFLFKSKLIDSTAGSKMTGDFWSGNWYHDSWTAVADANAKLPDAFGQTVQQSGNLSDLAFPDLTGKVQSLSNPDLFGEVTLVELFGTWCPNCHDEAAYLRELRQEYSGKGLKVIGLAFELSGNFEKDARQVRRYVERFEIDYPILIAGISDKTDASEKVPMLDRVRSYPTTLFVDSRGEIRAIYTGFNGPATGEANKLLRRQFTDLIEKLLDES